MPPASPPQVFRGKDGRSATGWSLRAAQEILQVSSCAVLSCWCRQDCKQRLPAFVCHAAASTLGADYSLACLLPLPNTALLQLYHACHLQESFDPVMDLGFNTDLLPLSTLTHFLTQHRPAICRSRSTPSWTWARTPTCCPSCCTRGAPASGTTQTASPCCCGTRQAAGLAWQEGWPGVAHVWGWLARGRRLLCLPRFLPSAPGQPGRSTRCINTTYCLCPHTISAACRHPCRASRWWLPSAACLAPRWRSCR